VTKAYEQVGVLAPFLFIALVMIAPTPGAIIGVSGVSYFGMPEAAIYLYIGNLIGVSITFLVVHHWGRPVAERLVKPEKLREYDVFIRRHKYLNWLVYTVPLFPIELITAVIALSGRKFKTFLFTVALALPFYAAFVTTIGMKISANHKQWLEYASIAISIIIVYSVLHFLYTWKREEIHATGRKIVESGKRAGKHLDITRKHIENAGRKIAVNVDKHVRRIGKR
jgi:uncharacterized membrane protein YdjX (TVP38/TMEM64 family)